MQDIDVIKGVYDNLSGKVEAGRASLGRPMTLAEKILVSHLDNPADVGWQRGSDFLMLRPDRVAMQDATAQMALLQFMMAGKDRVAVPSTVHCDHLIQARTGASHDLLQALDGNQEVYDFLRSSQYTDMAQINPKAKQSHPHAYPKNAMDSHGGWGHNPGFEGYGPICMLTGQGALAFAMLNRCGIEVDRRLHDYAYEFLARGTGQNGYVWYEDQNAGNRKWADMGRTGAAGLANFLSPYQDAHYRKRAIGHATVIGEHPESFPDTHGSPTMGMGYAAAAASFDQFKNFEERGDDFRNLIVKKLKKYLYV